MDINGDRHGLRMFGVLGQDDIEKMQGSTVEAMSSAVEGAAVMCYAISQAYKESTNCRMEAQYAFQQQKDMIPLMLEEGYRANGWLGMLLGVRMWYAFCGSVLASEGAFEGKMEELCRELGERGRVLSTAAAADTGGSAEELVQLLKSGGDQAEDTLASANLMASGGRRRLLLVANGRRCKGFVE